MLISRRNALHYFAITGLGACCGCHVTPVTNRRQLLLVPEGEELAMGLSAFEEVKTSEPASENAQYVSMVERVGQRLATVANKSDYEWEFQVIADATQNAFCLPGGKVVIYEGIMPVCANEAGLAVVMSHEIAHALARHGGERMSHRYAVDGVQKAVSYFTRSQEEKKRQIMLQAYGAASKYGVILPYSRKHEFEADEMGLLLMAKAGYDPAEAPRFWNRFAAIKTATGTPEFLSTHPADDKRAEALQQQLPEAQAIYNQAANKFGLGETITAAPVQVSGNSNAALATQGYFPTTMPTPQVGTGGPIPAGPLPPPTAAIDGAPAEGSGWMPSLPKLGLPNWLPKL